MHWCPNGKKLIESFRRSNEAYTQSLQNKDNKAAVGATYDSLKIKKGDEAIHPAGKSAGFLALNYNNNNKPLPMLGAAVFSFLLQYCANGIS